MGDGITHSYRRAGEARKTFEARCNQAMQEYWLLGDKRTYKNLSVAKLMEFILTNSQLAVEIRKKESFIHKKYGLNDVKDDIYDSEKAQYDLVPLYYVEFNVNGVRKSFDRRLSLRDALECAYVFAEWATSPEGEEACQAYHNNW